MNVEDFREYCLGLGNVSEKMPFGRFARRYESVLAFYVCGHMFCFVDVDDFTWVNLKSTPEEIEELRMRHISLSRPLNQSLHHWVQVELGGDIPAPLTRALVARAYDIVKAKYTPRERKSRKNNTRG